MRRTHHTRSTLGVSTLIAGALLGACTTHESHTRDTPAQQITEERRADAEEVPLSSVPMSPVAPPASTTPPDGVASLDGREVRYVTRGWHNTAHRRRAVVLVHGWASSTLVWRRQLDALAPHTRVIALDLPGHGESEMPAQKLSMDLFADAIAGVMDDAGIDSGVLVGHSNGTPTIRQFYRNYPERTEGLVIVDGALKPFFTPETVAPFIEQVQGPEGERFVTAMIRGMYASSPDPPEQRIDDLTRMALATPRQSMVGALRAGVDPSIWFDDPIDVPTLVVLADAPFWDEAYEAHVRNLVADLEYHKLTGVSHFLMMDDPETFNTLLLDFLRRVDFIDE